MNNEPRQKLRELVARHGPAVVHDRRRCEGLLRDCCGEHRREIAVLVMALEEHVPADLLAASAGLPREALLPRLARRLSDNLALSEEAARWSVNSWALALGVISDDELKTLERDAPAPPTGTGNQDGTTAAPRASAAGVAVVSADGNGDFRSISAALKSAAPGARILVRPGVYDEAVALDREVEIVGDGPREQVVIRSAGASCLQMLTERARVAGLTLRGAAAESFALDIPQGALVLEDCDVSSETLSCVGVHGATAAPVLRRCRIHDGADSGLYFFDGAAGAVEDCEIHGQANVAVAVTDRAQPDITRTKIYGGANAGLAVWADGNATLAECEIFRNRLAGVGVSEGGRLTARACRFYEGDNSGVFVHRGGEAVLEDCELFGHRQTEAAVTTRGRLFLNACRVRDSHGPGVFIREGGQALLQACVVSANAGSGVSVGAESVLAVLASRMSDNARFAVEVGAGASVKVEDSDLTGNRLGAWDAERGANVEAERNRD